MTVSIKEVAAKAGVSVGTVSNVLNNPDKVNEDTRAKVETVIHQLGFVRNDAARQLRAGQSKTIGMIVLDASNPFFTAVANGAEQKASEHNLQILLANSDENLERESNALALFEEQRSRGILISPTSKDLKFLKATQKRGTKIVLLDYESSDKAFSSVSVDDVAGGFMAASHLLEQNKKRIWFAGGPFTITQIQDRLEGAQQAVDAKSKATLTVQETSNLTVQEGRRIGELILELPKSQRPDAVFCANDMLAIGVMQTVVVDGKLSIPGDIALIGYDDIEFASAAIIPLTSIKQPAKLIGAQAVQLLLEEQKGKTRQVVFQPELVVRATT